MGLGESCQSVYQVGFVLTAWVLTRRNLFTQSSYSVQDHHNSFINAFQSTSFSKTAECWWLSNILSIHLLTPTSRHPPLALRLRTHNYRPADHAAPTQRQKSPIGTLTCLQETVYWHQSHFPCPRFISKLENQQQQQPAANSPTKVIAVAWKGSMSCISMPWHSEKYWTYYSMKSRHVWIVRRWGWNDTSLKAKMLCPTARSHYFAVREWYLLHLFQGYK